MKAIILAAGYATRLYPLTKDRPKPLLPIVGKTILDYLCEKIEVVREIDEVILVTNDKFANHFEEWKLTSPYTKKITVLNDGTKTNETRLGAIGDIQFVIKKLGINEDIMVLAGDNLFDFSLVDFVNYFNEVNTDCITSYSETNKEQLKRAGVITLDTKSKVLSFEEKPTNPQSTYCVPAFYLYKKETLPLFHQYLEEGFNPDAPGHFVPFLLKNKDVHAYLFKGKRYDIGTLESYQNVQDIFSNK